MNLDVAFEPNRGRMLRETFDGTLNAGIPVGAALRTPWSKLVLSRTALNGFSTPKAVRRGGSVCVFDDRQRRFRAGAGRS